MSSFGDALLWRRAQDYIARYQPLVIGVAGSTGARMAAEAIRLVLKENRAPYLPPLAYESPSSIAHGILGRRSNRRSNWYQILTGSLVRELKEEEPDTLILELNANRPGEIDWLSQHLPVRLAAITDAGTRHTELFGGRAEVAHELQSLLFGSNETTFAFLNADDPFVAAFAKNAPAEAVTIGRANSADIRVLRLQRLSPSGFAAELSIQGRHADAHFRYLMNPDQINYALFGVAAAIALKLDPLSALKQLQSFTPPDGRLKLISGRHGSHLLDDSFDASPESLLSSLQTLHDLPPYLPVSLANSGRTRRVGEGLPFRDHGATVRRIAILGDISDLGHESHAVHEQIGGRAAQSAHILIAVGEAMRTAGAQAIQAGIDVHHFEKSIDVGKWLVDYLQPNDLVLISGSRSMKMAEVVSRLRG